MASILVLVIVSVFDLIAFALAVAAEQRRSTAKIISAGTTSSYCSYDKDIASGLGAGAFVLLLVSQLIIMVASRCLCCGRGLRPGGSRRCAVMLFIICWVLFFIAEACLLAGSAKNAYHTKYRGVLHSHASCQTLRKGVFGAGAAFIFLTGIVSKFYYHSYSKSNADFGPTYSRDTGVRMSTL